MEQTTFELSTPGWQLPAGQQRVSDDGAVPAQSPADHLAERFLERIWGYDSEVEVSVVWVYISYLRKKLTALQADVEIRASRNLGYSLEVRT